jgi:hypothetical protein
VGGYAPLAPEESMRQRRLVGASGRPLNFTSKDFPVVSSVLSISGSFDCQDSVEQEGQTA